MEHDWSSFLGNHSNTGLYFLPLSKKEEGRIMEAAKDYDLNAVTINMNRVSRKQTFLAKFAKAMQFPVYFGQNWDALLDCLTDLSWTTAKGQVILIYNLRHMANKSPEDFRIIRQIFKGAADYWQSRQMLFFIIISETQPRRARSCHDR